MLLPCGYVLALQLAFWYGADPWWLCVGIATLFVAMCGNYTCSRGLERLGLSNILTARGLLYELDASLGSGSLLSMIEKTL